MVEEFEELCRSRSTLTVVVAAFTPNFVDCTGLVRFSFPAFVFSRSGAKERFRRRSGWRLPWKFWTSKKTSYPVRKDFSVVPQDVIVSPSAIFLACRRVSWTWPELFRVSYVTTYVSDLHKKRCLYHPAVAC